MASLFDEINIEKTKSSSEEVLKQYRKLKMISRREIQQKLTISYDSQPMGTGDGTPAIERKMIAKVFAEQETERIEKAVASLPNEIHRRVLEEKYLNGYEKTDTACYDIIDISSSSYTSYKAEALEAVAWALGCEVYTSVVPQQP